MTPHDSPLPDPDRLDLLVLEGDRDLGRPWSREAVRRGAEGQPASLRHDAAEAVRIGLWALVAEAGCRRCHPASILVGR